MVDQQPLEQKCKPKNASHDPDSSSDSVHYHSGHRHLLKSDELFAVLGRGLDIHYAPEGEHGLFYRDCRYLSRWEMRIFNRAPVVLQALQNVSACELVTRLISEDAEVHGQPVESGRIHITRSVCLVEKSLVERVELRSFADHKLSVPLEFRIQADFKDIFEIRKIPRRRRGRLLPPRKTSDSLEITYRGLDSIERTLSLDWSVPPDKIRKDCVCFNLELMPRESFTIETQLTVAESDTKPVRGEVSYALARKTVAKQREEIFKRTCTITTDNSLVNKWIEHSTNDLQMLITRFAHGPYPFAGLPWFAAIFGRDGLITAWQALWHDPDLARGVLGNLAALQAGEADTERSMEPGKIIHEFRRGEMANLNEVPFGSYYGSVDGTALFVILAADYCRLTGDRQFLDSIWSNLLACYRWLTEQGDLDGDGFIEYARSAAGLLDQGWKDTPNAITHRDGSFAPGPIALCEVQGYAYLAMRKLAWVARWRDEHTLAETLNKRADDLYARFNERFWWEEEGTYYLALDGNKKPCRLISSNPGHCLWSGIVDPERAPRVRESLRGLNSGWGIRTLSRNEAIYNPVSYHQGSVWPHDTALVAAGLANYHFKDDTLELFSATFDASRGFEHHRLPELFCGFSRLEEEYPTHFPGACAPQAWASSCVFTFFTAMLGLQFDATRRELAFHSPALPSYLGRIDFRNFKMGDETMDFCVYRHEGKVSVCIENASGDLRIAMKDPDRL